ncbi:MAG: RagB/SusD family nutrient uptake outer membrane protein [Gemmatimonadaceae bacterium]
MSISILFRSRLLTATWLLLIVASTSCSSLLDVEVPSRVPVSEAFAPANAELLMNSVIGEFECSFGGAVLFGGALGDEFGNANTGNTSWQIDRRDMTPTANIGAGACGVFGGFSVTLYFASQFRKLLESWTDAQVPNRRQYLARTAAYSGYAHLLMGEMMCTATVDQGPELTKAQVFALAEERFSAAIADGQATNQADVLNMSRVGRARTRLNLGNKTGASTDASQVPVGFVKNATYSATDPRRYNPVFQGNNQGIQFTVGPVYRALQFNGVADPRVSVTDAKRVGQDATTPMFLQGKYTGLGSPIPIAKWQEARLIDAEAALDAGNLQTAVSIINQLHSAAMPPLPSFSSASATEIRNQLIYERRAELFLESQHLFDATRYSLPFVPAVGTPFPFGGGFYSTQRCFFLPDIERNSNPNLNGGRS